MERYKKRTIALCLASLLTVVGAFGAENYDNTLMGLKINSGSGGYVSMTAYTQKPYSIPAKTTKLDDNTYAITLANTNSTASAPDIDSYENIESIEISTYPYTTESDGYTRIVVKTNGNPMFQASHALYIPDNSHSSEPEPYENDDYDDTADDINTAPQDSDVAESSVSDSNETEETNNSSDNIQNAFTPPNYRNQNSGNEYMMVLFCISVLAMLIGFIFIFGRDKMASVVGDQSELDVKDNKKQSKTKKLKSAINKLDEKYTNKKNASDFIFNQTDEYTQDKEDENYSSGNSESEELQQDVIVDLDMLYQESKKTSSDNTVEAAGNTDEYDDLADLMSNFITDIPQEEVQEKAFDEELYNKIINSKTLNFSDSDIQKIDRLLQVEVSQETIENLEKYLTTPIQKTVTKDQVLADLLATYSVRQNINFTEEDVSAIKKLMNVELSPDFTKDFSTNPARTKIVEKEILENTGKKPHRTSEVITLSVKDMLPDLSKELKKQGGKAIKSEVKPTVVYYSEGYEYEKFKVSDDFKNIDINSKQNEYKPSYQAPIVESGYEFSTLSIKDELPDLADVKAHPGKYQDNKIAKPKVDERALLKSISNVTFKPFYEESENKPEPFNEETDTKVEITTPAPVQVSKSAKNIDNAEKLLKLIEAQKTERALKQQSAEEMEAFKKELESAAAKNKKQKENKQSEPYNFEGENAKLISSINCTKNSTCKLVRTNDKYIVLGNINEKEVVLKEYSSLKNDEMQIRRNSKTDKSTYLIKIGLNKFIIRITEDNMEFVMDLC